MFNANKMPFQGWKVLGGATIGMALGFSNVGVALFGMFVVPLSEAFGWGRGDISIAILLVNATIVIASPLLGLWLDRLGPRRVILPSIVLFAFAIAAVATVNGNIIHFYAAYIMLTLVGIGTIPATYTRIAIAWFDEKRGLAIGLSMAGIGIGAMVLPPLVQALIGRFGWQGGYLGLAALVLAIALPATWLLLIDKPADVGQFADGKGQPESHEAGRNALAGFSFSECLRKPALWMMALGFVLLGLFTSGLMAHLVPLLRDRGVSAELAALGASTLGLALVVGRVICGLLLDRFHASGVVAGFLLGPVCGLALLAGGATGVQAFAATLLIGLGIGAELDFMSYLVSRYLGQRAYGRSYGLLYAAFAIGAGLGPLLMGFVYEAQGRYDQALWLLCVAVIIAIIPFTLLGSYPDFHGDSGDEA